MGIGKTLRRIEGYGIKPKNLRHARQKIGLTGKKIKKAFGRSVLASPVATSATTEGYRYTPRSLSQLTGGV